MNIQQLKTSLIQTVEPFVGLFPIDQAVLDRITENMRLDGFDAAHPIILWDRPTIGDDSHHFKVIDGHTRLEAAIACGVDEIPAAVREFIDEDEAVDYAIHCQRDRRNISDADLTRWIGEMDKRKAQGERTDLAPDGAKSGKSAAETAALIGISTRRVERVRTVIDHADEEAKAAVLAGEKSINQAYNQTQAKRKGRKPCEKCGVQMTGPGRYCPYCRGTKRLAATGVDKAPTVNAGISEDEEDLLGDKAGLSSKIQRQLNNLRETLKGHNWRAKSERPEVARQLRELLAIVESGS